MFVDSGFAHTHLPGDFTKCESLLKMQQNDFSANGRNQSGYAALQSHYLFLDFLGSAVFHIVFEHAKFFHLLLNLVSPQGIQASVAHTRQQERSGGCFLHIHMIIYKKLGKHIVHHVFTQLIVVQ